jgi:hypothetical protein
MRSIVLALAATLFPLAAHAGENVAYIVDGEAFEGYRAKPPVPPRDSSSSFMRGAA